MFSLVANAKFIEGIVKFNDGHEEKGLIKSFLEERWFFKQYSKSLEKELNFTQTQKEQFRGRARSFGHSEGVRHN